MTAGAASARRRVLLVGEDGTWFRRDYERAFSEAGFDVDYVPTEAPEDNGPSNRRRDALTASRARIQTAILDVLSRSMPALFFCYAYDRSLSAETLRLIRRLPCPSVLLHVDLEGQWYHAVRSCNAFTLVAVAQREHTDALRRRGARLLHWPMAGFASNPDWSAPRRALVRFLGFPSRSRVRALEALAAAAVPIEIYGRWNRAVEAEAPSPMGAPTDLRRSLATIADRARRGAHALPAIFREEGFLAAWRRRRASPALMVSDYPALEAHLLGPVPNSALAVTLAGAQVTLGCTETDGGDDKGRRMMRLRDFEAPLAGACYLTQRSPGLDECYEIGKEVLVWEKAGDLIREAKALLAEPARCLDVARAGWRRAQRDHTYEVRLHSLFEALGLSLQGTMS